MEPLNEPLLFDLLDKILNLEARTFDVALLETNVLGSVTKAVLSQLSWNCESTSRAITTLVRSGFLWECDMLDRSVAEASMRMLFIANATTPENMAHELAFIIPDAMRLRNHKMMSRAMYVIDLNPVYEPLRAMLLSDEELEHLERTFPARRRKELEQRWSFGAISRQLAKIDPNFSHLAHLSILYSLGSHHLHQDGEALKMQWARAERPSHTKVINDKLHKFRLLSDVLAFGKMRQAAISHLCGESRTHHLTELRHNLAMALKATAAQLEAELKSAHHSGPSSA